MGVVLVIGKATCRLVWKPWPKELIGCVLREVCAAEEWCPYFQHR